MKFTSIIFIFISVILVIGGIFTMTYARKLAGDDVLIDGYSWTEDGQNITTMSLENTEIIKIALTLSDCDVVVAGGAEESYVELKNFKPNAYLCTTSGRSLTVSDNISIMDYLSFDGSGMKFAGVWPTLYTEYKTRNLSKEEMRRSIVVHVKDSEELKQINLSLSNCSLSLHDIAGTGDIKISGSDSEIELSNITSTILAIDGKDMEYTLLGIEASRFTSELKSGTVTANGINAKTVDLKTGETKISLLKTNFTDFTAKIEKGDLKLSTDYNMTNFARSFETKNGSIITDGVNIGSSFSSDKETEYPGSIIIEIEEGNADISYGDLLLIVDDGPASPDTDIEPEE